jgi:drug/metabolite transporter (DMT)-like permease
MASASQEATKKKIVPFLMILVGVMGVSTSSIFVKLAAAHPFVKCAYRVLFASLVFWPVALAFYRDEFKKLGRRDVVLTLLSGAFLSVHFATWMSSLDYTTVASSLMLVNTVPVWMALINLLLGRGRQSPVMWMCILLAVVGASIVGYGDLSFHGDALFGDLLALAGGVAAAAYLFCGGEVRGKLSLAPYVAICYGSCALIMWSVVLALRLPITGFSLQTWGAFVGMALLAQVVGHSTYNWALRYFSTGFVSIALLGEPLGGALLAYFLFGEYPAGFKLVGFALLIASIVISARAERA